MPAMGREEIDLGDMLLAAWRLAQKSEDPSTQLGAILFRENDDSSLESKRMGDYVVRAVNHLPKGTDRKVWQDRDAKYKHVIHAECAVINLAKSLDYTTDGATMVCPWACCLDCAKAIVGAGVSVLVVDDEAMKRTPDRWAQTIIDAHEYLQRKGVDVISLPTPENKPTTMFGGEEW